MGVFVTFRRHFLDLNLRQTHFEGDVLDVGGERKTTRGGFRPPVAIRSWKFLNVNPKTEPDFCCSAEAIPLEDNSVDMVLIAEVLEHLENPTKVLKECHRVLKVGGTIFVATPFLFPVHGDPNDFRRWTRDGLILELVLVGFKTLKVQAMGGIIAVMGDLFEAYCQEFYIAGKSPGFVAKVIRKFLRWLAIPLLLPLDARVGFSEKVTTGYFLTAKKEASI